LVSRAQLVDVQGNPLRMDGEFSGGHHGPAHEAASRYSAELATWRPPLLSGDGEVLSDLYMLRNRTRDMIRNHGLMSGAVQTHLDNVIGGGWRLNSKPNWRYLGVKDLAAAAEWEADVEAKWCNYATDPANYIDASRRVTFAGLMAQAYRTYLTTFEVLATSEWLTRPGTSYKTCIQVLDPQRLSNPMGFPNTQTLRAGVEHDAMGAPVSYWIGSEVCTPGVLYYDMNKWVNVPRETPWGRQLVIHLYDMDSPGQSRGKSGIVSVLTRGKMTEKFEKATLEASILNAMYAAVIESSMDWNAVGAALGVGDSKDDPVLDYMGNRVGFHKENSVRFAGARIPHLFPGENLKMLSPQHPTAAFNSFEEAAHRYMAAGFNMTYEQFSRDYSKSNYSSMRAGLLEVWKFFNGRQQFIAAPFARHIYALWLEEAIDRGDVELLAGTPDFYEAKAAWTGCKWIGPGRGHIDPEKEQREENFIRNDVDHAGRTRG
jgi:lambda family phage portal protein